MDIDQTQEAHHIAMIEKGFHNDWYGLLAVLQDEPEHLAVAREAIVGQRISMIHSEISEALEGRRRGKAYVQPEPSNLNDWEDDNFKHYYESFHKDHFPSELAGAILRILDLAEFEGVDLSRAIQLEMRYNQLRPHKNGKAY